MPSIIVDRKRRVKRSIQLRREELERLRALERDLKRAKSHEHAAVLAKHAQRWLIVFRARPEYRGMVPIVDAWTMHLFPPSPHPLLVRVEEDYVRIRDFAAQDPTIILEEGGFFVPHTEREARGDFCIGSHPLEVRTASGLTIFEVHVSKKEAEKSPIFRPHSRTRDESPDNTALWTYDTIRRCYKLDAT